MDDMIRIDCTRSKEQATDSSPSLVDATLWGSALAIRRPATNVFNSIHARETDGSEGGFVNMSFAIPSTVVSVSESPPHFSGGIAPNTGQNLRGSAFRSRTDFFGTFFLGKKGRQRISRRNKNAV